MSSWTGTDGIYTVVLTGGIASGKTAVSRCFERMGAAVIDTDVIARQIVEPGQPALARIVEEFGADFLDHEGRLNRRMMRDAIFSDPDTKIAVGRDPAPANRRRGAAANQAAGRPVLHPGGTTIHRDVRLFLDGPRAGSGRQRGGSD